MVKYRKITSVRWSHASSAYKEEAFSLISQLQGRTILLMYFVLFLSFSRECSLSLASVLLRNIFKCHLIAIYDFSYSTPSRLKRKSKIAMPYFVLNLLWTNYLTTLFKLIFRYCFLRRKKRIPLAISWITVYHIFQEWSYLFTICYTVVIEHQDNY